MNIKYISKRILIIYMSIIIISCNTKVPSENKEDNPDNDNVVVDDDSDDNINDNDATNDDYINDDEGNDDVEVTLYASGEWANWVSPFNIEEKCLVEEFNANNWNDHYIDYGCYLYSLWGTDKYNIWIVGQSGLQWIYKGLLVHYDGFTWDINEDENMWNIVFYGIWGISNKNIYAVGMKGREEGITFGNRHEYVVYQYNGYHWSVVVQGYELNSILTGIWYEAANEVYAVGYWEAQSDNKSGYLILQYDGKEWSEQRSNYGALSGIWGMASDEVYAVGNQPSEGTNKRPLIMKYNGKWEEMKNNIQDGIYFHSIMGNSDMDLYAVGGCITNIYDGGVVFHYDGEEWKDMGLRHGGYLTSIWVYSSNNIYVAGTWGIIHYNGEKWEDEYHAEGTSINDLWGINQNK